MCGILFCLYDYNKCDQKSLTKDLVDNLTPLIARRGPDYLRCDERVVSNDQFKMKCIGSVLHLRGHLTPQPLNDIQGNLLLWNGEVFGGTEITEEQNDTLMMLHLLGKYPDTSSVSHILKTMASIQGPWSFMFYQQSRHKIWFGRDFFGRRSLVWHLPSKDVPILAVSSVAQRSSDDEGRNWVWQEVPADGIYCLELNPDQNHLDNIVESFHLNSFQLVRYLWDPLSREPDENLCKLTAPVIPFNKQLPSQLDLKLLDKYYSDIGLTVHNHLPRDNPVSSTYTINCNSSRYSENMDKLAYIGTKLTPMNCASGSSSVTNKNTVQDVQEKTSSTDSVQTLQQLCNKLLSSNDKQYSDGTSTATQCVEHYTVSFKRKLDQLPQLFIDVLGEAVRKRVFNLPRNQTKQQDNSQSCTEQCLSRYALSGREQEKLPNNFHKDFGSLQTRVGVLFSGGIDSIVLAALADRFVPENEGIDLINVAFEQKPPKENPTNKRKPKADKASSKPPSFQVPDRKTGKAGLIELANINPNRQWNFIEANVVLEDLQNARSEHITHLVSPLNSVLDDSIGCALWFAARGSGVLRCPSCVGEDAPRSCIHPIEYKSTAKVFLVGMGADEQLGGYARHRTKFNQHGWLGLVNEMEMEVNRISGRNLGRDDRCISDHGREARFPFLDEKVVSFLSGLPVYMKADLRLPRGTGEKLLLRESAKLLGLTSSAVLPKRAIQFGSRIAKLENSNEKGSDTCGRLK